MNNTYHGPSPDRLREMHAAQIGRAILPLVERDLRQHGNKRDPRWLAKGVCESEYRSDPSVTLLLMEGVQSLIRSGLLVPDPFSDDRYLLSRAGTEAARASNVQMSSIIQEESVALLHPIIRAAALGDLEQGPERYDAAVLMAFRAVEIAIGKAIAPAKVPDKKSVFDVAFGVHDGGRRGILTPEPMSSTEATAILNLFKSSSSALRNPVVHTDVGHDDPVQTMRLLVTASALVEMVERLNAART